MTELPLSPHQKALIAEAAAKVRGDPLHLQAYLDGITAGTAGVNLVEPLRPEHKASIDCHALFLLGVEEGRARRDDFIARLMVAGIVR
jgi:hypothetical protein